MILLLIITGGCDFDQNWELNYVAVRETEATCYETLAVHVSSGSQFCGPELYSFLVMIALGTE